MTLIETRCLACGGSLSFFMNSSKKALAKTKVKTGRRPDSLSPFGCEHCGHAMLFEDGKLRDLTRVEAANVDVPKWRIAVEKVVGERMWG